MKVAADLARAGWTHYAAVPPASPPQVRITWGQFRRLAASRDSLSRLAYLAYADDGSAQLSSALGNAGMAIVSPSPYDVAPASSVQNAVFRHMTSQPAGAAARGEQVPRARGQ